MAFRPSLYHRPSTRTKPTLNHMPFRVSPRKFVLWVLIAACLALLYVSQTKPSSLPAALSFTNYHPSSDAIASPHSIDIWDKAADDTGLFEQFLEDSELETPTSGYPANKKLKSTKEVDETERSMLGSHLALHQEIPLTEHHVKVAGFNLFDNLYLKNGTIYVVVAGELFPILFVPSKKENADDRFCGMEKTRRTQRSLRCTTSTPKACIPPSRRKNDFRPTKTSRSSTRNRLRRSSGRTPL